MCIGGGGGGGYAPSTYQYQKSDHSGYVTSTDPNLPQAAVDAGVGDSQVWEQQQESQAQIAAQKQIADQQNTFNQQQLQAQQDQQAQQAQQAAEQATRQDQYDTGRAQLLSQGTQQINDAFKQFSPDYFNQYQSDYMKQATDDINYQQALAQKQLQFGLARQGLSESQTKANQEGQLAEDSGRATATQEQNALSATNQLQNQVAASKQSLLGQVTASESIGSPIAGGNNASVNSALQTQSNAISGITNSAGDTTASLQGVPTATPLVNIFSDVLGTAGNYAGGLQANSALSAYNKNASSSIPGGSSPFASSASVR